MVKIKNGKAPACGCGWQPLERLFRWLLFVPRKQQAVAHAGPEEETALPQAICVGRTHRMVPERKGGQPMPVTETTAQSAQARRVLLELLENVIAAQFEEETAEEPA